MQGLVSTRSNLEVNGVHVETNLHLIGRPIGSNEGDLQIDNELFAIALDRQGTMSSSP